MKNKNKQLKKYLPTLKLKQFLLNKEIMQCKEEISNKKRVYEEKLRLVHDFADILPTNAPVGWKAQLKVIKVITTIENIAGVDVPIFQRVEFTDKEDHLLFQPLWIDKAINEMKELITCYREYLVAIEKKHILEAEFRTVSIRINLFERVLIPESEAIINKIKHFLGDQELAAIARAKMAKKKKKLKLYD